MFNSHISVVYLSSFHLYLFMFVADSAERPNNDINITAVSETGHTP